MSVLDRLQIITKRYYHWMTLKIKEIVALLIVVLFQNLNAVANFQK